MFLTFLAIQPVNGQKLFRELKSYCEKIVSEFDQIPKERKEELRELGNYIYESKSAGERVKLTVICTHNSRRSHMGQLWLYTAAAWYGVEDISAYSGGTEATAFNPRAVDALNRAGFRISKTNSADNPTYNATFQKGIKQRGVLMYSKKFSDRQNPTEGFAAIMVCSDADKSCPVVPGAEARYSFPFDDPRYFDDTPSEELEYDKTVRLIAREMFYVMNHTKELLIIDKESEKQDQ